VRVDGPAAEQATRGVVVPAVAGGPSSKPWPRRERKAAADRLVVVVVDAEGLAGPARAERVEVLVEPGAEDRLMADHGRRRSLAGHRDRGRCRSVEGATTTEVSGFETMSRFGA
jgi:hypothetical protein